MLDELPADWLLDWKQFHRQFNLGFNRDDLHWGLLNAMFHNANKGDGELDKSPADMMPYYDALDEDDDAFMASMRGFARSVKGQQPEV